MPRVWAQAFRCDGTRNWTINDMMKTATRCKMQVRKTRMARRYVGSVLDFETGKRGVA